MRIAVALALALGPGAPVLGAQIDYRNLDHGRPLRTEDAYALERYAFEVAVPYELERHGGASLHVVAPELTHGIARNTHLAVEWPIAVVDAGESDLGLAGPRASLLYNFNTEAPSVPGLGVRAELILPVGDLAPDHPLASVTGLATRSWGRTRAHLNAAATLGPIGRTDVAVPPRWMLSAAVDRTLLRRSILLLAELRVEGDGDGTGTAAGIGGRMQLTPTIVLDAGVTGGLGGGVAPDLGLTVGLSHGFGIAWLMPLGPR